MQLKFGFFHPSRAFALKHFFRTGVLLFVNRFKWGFIYLHILQGRALYAAEADRLRNWAENRAQFSFTDAMEMYTENTWVSVFSLSVVCAFIILSSTGSTFPGTWFLAFPWSINKALASMILVKGPAKACAARRRNVKVQRRIDSLWSLYMQHLCSCLNHYLVLNCLGT